IPHILIPGPERGSMSRSTHENQKVISQYGGCPISLTPVGRGSSRAGSSNNRTAFIFSNHCGSKNRASAFSLIEVIVAVAILSIAVVGLAHGISTALGSSKEAEWQTTACMYAAGLIENLRAEGGLIDGQTEGDCGQEL